MTGSGLGLGILADRKEAERNALFYILWGIPTPPNYVHDAERRRGNTGDLLIEQLERRLDVLVLRAGFARTLYQARQFVSHGHVRVNGGKVKWPSAPIKVGDEISLKEESRGLDVQKLALVPSEPPAYMARDGEIARLIRLPVREEVPVICEVSTVIEYYAK